MRCLKMNKTEELRFELLKIIEEVKRLKNRAEVIKEELSQLDQK